MASRVVAISKYKDKKGEWRWRARARNGRVVAESGEGYKHEEDLDNTLLIHAFKDDDYSVADVHARSKPVIRG